MLISTLHYNLGCDDFQNQVQNSHLDDFDEDLPTFLVRRLPPL